MGANKEKTEEEQHALVVCPPPADLTCHMPPHASPPKQPHTHKASATLRTSRRTPSLPASAGQTAPSRSRLMRAPVAWPASPPSSRSDRSPHRQTCPHSPHTTKPSLLYTHTTALYFASNNKQASTTMALSRRRGTLEPLSSSGFNQRQSMGMPSRGVSRTSLGPNFDKQAKPQVRVQA